MELQGFLHFLSPSPFISTLSFLMSCWDGTGSAWVGSGGERGDEDGVQQSRRKRVREGRVVNLPGGVLNLNHTYFKANSRSFIQLPGSIDVTWTGSIYLPREFRGEKSMWGLFYRESMLMPER